MDAYSVLYGLVNIQSVAVLLIIAIRSSRINVETNVAKKYFMYSVLCSAAANFFDFIWNMEVSGRLEVPSAILKISCFMFYMCYGLAAYYWFAYAEKINKTKIGKSKKRLAAWRIPLVLLAVVTLYITFNMSGYNPLLNYFAFSCIFVYVLYESLNSLAKAANEKNYEKKRRLLSVVYFAVPLLISGVMQIFEYELPMTSIGVTISFLIAMIDSMQMMISSDQLTGMNNRTDLFKMLDDKMSSVKKNERLYFLFIDIDSFKKINDTYGHDEGDRALKIVSSSLKEVCEANNGYCARYGGDEFAVVQVLPKNEDIALIRKAIYETIEKKTEEKKLEYAFNVSIGCSEYNDSCDAAQKLIAKADSDMYNKKMLKKEKTIFRQTH